MPKRLDSLEGLEVAWKFKPCEKIGGDIFNLIQLDDEHWAIYIIADGLVETVFKSLMAFGNNTEPKDDVSLLGIELKNIVSQLWHPWTDYFHGPGHTARNGSSPGSSRGCCADNRRTSMNDAARLSARIAAGRSGSTEMVLHSD